MRKRMHMGYKSLQGKLSGYMTVEASYIFVTAVSIIVFAVSVGIYKFERCSFELGGLYELQKAVQTCESGQEYITIEGRRVTLERKKEIRITMGIFGERERTLQIKAKGYRLDPITGLRRQQRLKRMQKDEYRKSESALAETNG